MTTSKFDSARHLAQTMTAADIEEARLLMRCDFCGAEPQQPCHSTKDPTRRAQTHSVRGAILWAMWHKGYRAGRERARSEHGEE